MEQNTLNSNNIDAGNRIASFRVKQNMPYEFKVNYARIRAWEFYNECGKRDLDCYVSVGGLDSITLFFFLKSIGIDVPAVSVSSLEDVSIQKIHKQIGVISLPPAGRADGTRWNKQKLIQEFGFPVLSKENDRAKNKSYTAKKAIYHDSEYIINKYFDGVDDWSVESARTWEQYLQEMVCKVFVI